MPKPRNLVAKRNADSTERYADVVRVAQRTQRTPGDSVHARCAKIEQNLRRVCAFSCENLHDFEPVTQQISAPNAALTQPTAFPTSLLLRSSRSARRPSFACGAHRIRTKFATHSRVFSRTFARFRTPYSRNLGARCSADSAESCTDAMRVAQRTRRMLAEFCERGASKSKKICVRIARFLAKISTIPNP